MSGITRITDALLDVLAYVLVSRDNGDEVYGWAIMHATKRSANTVYGSLDRLEDAEWITGRWEDNPEEGRPRRRLFELTPNGEVEARQLLAERRPAQKKRSAILGLALLQTTRYDRLRGIAEAQ